MTRIQRLRPVKARLTQFGAALAMGLITACASQPVGASFDTLAASATGKGFSEAGLAKLEAAMADQVDDGNVIGISTLLVKDGQVIQYTQNGTRSMADAAPITEDTIFRIYSMTKPITGVALMTLYEDGAFTLDDPVTKFVPEFSNLKVLNGVDAKGAPILVNAARAPTMREVMSHTAGFAYGLGGTDAANQAFRDQRILGSPDLDTYIDRVAGVPLLFQPGTNWSYSTSVDIQGYIIQKISGKRLGQFLSDEIFTPLGMKDTGFFVPEDKLGRFSDLLVTHPTTGGLSASGDRSTQFRRDTIAMESGGHGLVSTMGDYARFAQMLVNEGALDGVRILKPETITLMRTNVLPAGKSIFSDGSTQSGDTVGHGFGLDFGIIVDPSATGSRMPAGTYYWGGAAGTWFWIDPVNDLFFIGMIQRFPSLDRAFRRQSGQLVYEAMEE